MSGETVLISAGAKRNRALVTEDGQVKTYSAVESEFASRSEEHRQSYEFHPHGFDLIADKWNAVYYMKNTSSDKNFHIEYVRMGTSGGYTTYTKPMQFRMYAEMTAPDTNVITGQFGVSAGSHNLYIGSEINPEMEIIFFDNLGSPLTGDGMTIGGVAMTSTQLGSLFNCGPLGVGSTYLTYGGALILPPSRSLGITLKPFVEDTKGFAVVAGYFKDVE